MPLFDTEKLLSSLEADVHALLQDVSKLSSIDDKLLNRQPAPGKWSAAQVIEHLNSYNRYYLPQIEKVLDRRLAFEVKFKSGWFGNYFTKLMQPGEGGSISNKMNAPKDHVPGELLNSAAVIKEFIAGQNRLLGYLQKARQTNIGKLRVPISISKFIKLKLGDTFRFLIAHQQRHFIQLHNALKK